MKRSSHFSPLEALESVKIRWWTFLTAARATSGKQVCIAQRSCGKPGEEVPGRSTVTAARSWGQKRACVHLGAQCLLLASCSTKRLSPQEGGQSSTPYCLEQHQKRPRWKKEKIRIQLLNYLLLICLCKLASCLDFINTTNLLLN